jgi:hypothetical protein
MTVVRESILSEEARWTIFLHIGDAFQCLSSERCEFSASEESGFACFDIQEQPHFKRVSRSELYWTILVRSYIGLLQLIRLKLEAS